MRKTSMQFWDRCSPNFAWKRKQIYQRKAYSTNLSNSMHTCYGIPLFSWRSSKQLVEMDFWFCKRIANCWYKSVAKANKHIVRAKIKINRSIKFIPMTHLFSRCCDHACDLLGIGKFRGNSLVLQGQVRRTSCSYALGPRYRIQLIQWLLWNYGRAFGWNLMLRCTCYLWNERDCLR